MDPRWRTLLFGFAACLVAAWVGVSLANGDYFIASVSALVCLWSILSWTRGPLAEGWLLAFLLFGYVIGNRGFAQITPVSGLPLFLSELGLFAIMTLTLLRGALKRSLPVHRDWLNGLLLLWMAIASVRILWDVRVYGLVAVRDFAMVYYVLYFFAAQAIAHHAPSRRILHGTLTLTFTVLPITALLAEAFPDFFMSNLLVAGVPLIYFKGDLLATYLFVGFILLLPLGRADWRRDGWRWLLAIISLVIGLLALSRSSLLGALVAIGWLAWSGRWRPARTFVAVCAAGLIAVTLFSFFQKKDFEQTRAYAIYEAAVSVVDFTGTHDYQSALSSDKGDNNRFRLTWWRTVAEETIQNSPLLGLGFGADLARGFLIEYYPTSETDFTARSPHNVFVTTFGRMGLVGFAVLGGIYLLQARATRKAVRIWRGVPEKDGAIALQAGCWVIMISACFGVVLEGPMGAIPFWTMLGLAHFQVTQPADEEN
jgi:O-antigen ligase